MCNPLDDQTIPLPLRVAAANAALAAQNATITYQRALRQAAHTPQPVHDLMLVWREARRAADAAAMAIVNLSHPL